VRHQTLRQFDGYRRVKSSATKRFPAFQSVNQGDSWVCIPISGAHGGTYCRVTSGPLLRLHADDFGTTIGHQAANPRARHAVRKFNHFHALERLHARKNPTVLSVRLGSRQIAPHHDAVTSNNAALSQPAHGLRREAELATEDLFVVLTDARRRPRDGPRRSAWRYGAPG